MKVSLATARRQAKRFKFAGSVRQLRMGIVVEQEHRNVVKTLDGWTQIAIAHLEELPDYYTKLKKMEG